MTLDQILNIFQSQSSSEHDKGRKFEILIRRWLLTDSVYADQINQVWLWSDFPYKEEWGNHDIGIDIVVKTNENDYWAVQCKFYAPGTTFTKEMVDSFISASGKEFADGDGISHTFCQRLWVYAYGKFNANALATINNQTIPFHRIGYDKLTESNADWDKIFNGYQGSEARKPGLTPLPHQKTATEKAIEYYITQNHSRGKLIMACGTGKTFTSLYMMERLFENTTDRRPLILFLVPSIALLGQTYASWKANATVPINAVCVCSDSKVADKTDDDTLQESIMDLQAPVSTNSNVIAAQIIRNSQKNDGLNVVFSTYQSIEAVHYAQQIVIDQTGGEYGEFDFAICDEAHRTASASSATNVLNNIESSYVRIHDNDFVRAQKRMYMTATPKIFSANIKAKANQDDAVLYSMDDKEIYGEEFFRVNFSYAVREGLLTDYKVWVLTVNEEDLPQELAQKARDPETKEINFDDTAKLIGCINGLSKRMLQEKGVEYDPQELSRKMRRAVAFCQQIGTEQKPGSSKNVAAILPIVSKEYINSINDPEERREIVNIDARHIDGSMDMGQRNEILSWLKTDDQADTCKIVCNVRCLSEGVDVPSLDAVLFLSARKSQVEVVQSVGRVMRNFRRGQEGGKEWGYIIIPVVVPSGVKPEDALNNDKNFDVVWKILNALRAHDDHFEAQINSIALDGRPRNIIVANGGKPKPKPASLNGEDTFGKPDGVSEEGFQTDSDETIEQKIARQLKINFGEMNGAIYARMVQKVGDRMYWDACSRKVGALAQKFISRINRFLDEPDNKYQTVFAEYLKGLQQNINPSVDRAQAVEMLAQHIITGPVFEALFEDYNFKSNNPVSRSMQAMVDLLKEDALGKDAAELDDFYKTVKFNIGQINTLEGKQTLIKTLYEKFFKGAFPTMVDKMGIVYTPVPCVDFILRHTDRLLAQEFGKHLTDEGVSIIDPFTGTGTFIARLLADDGALPPLIKNEDLSRKYLNEIFCNEILLMAYYIADVNIESVYNQRAHNCQLSTVNCQLPQYTPYNHITLTDTFQLAERQTDFVAALFGHNTQDINHLRTQKFRVIIGNPPYSVGQKSANDNAQNEHYPYLERRIAETYAAKGTAMLKNALYDSYIKAFRWASDKIKECADGGIVSFISNGSWLDNNSFDGFRRCLEAEFTDIYVLNLRGNARTSGELRRKEKDNVFGQGTRTTITITTLIYNPAKVKERGGKAVIHYHDIGDYLSRDEKLKIITRFTLGKSAINWDIITPNKHGDWLSMRDDSFAELLPLAPEKKFDPKTESVFVTYSNGVTTQRDAFTYNSSKEQLSTIITESINFYNGQRQRLNSGAISQVEYDNTKLTWSDMVLRNAKNDVPYIFETHSVVNSVYRPFFKQHLYFSKQLNDRQGQMTSFFPTPNHKNLMICVSGLGGTKEETCLICDRIMDRNSLHSGTQCFPLYWYESRSEYEKSVGAECSLFGSEVAADGFDEYGYRKRDGISDWIHNHVCHRYNTTKKNITKEMIFYAVYSLLHNQAWRTKYAANLKKELPRIPLPDGIDDFLKEVSRGKTLAALHLGYETFSAPEGVIIKYLGNAAKIEDIPTEHFKVQKMRFPTKTQKDVIIYNPWITIEGIPSAAYDYIVNGKSAVEWVMERYAVSTDKASGILNDPNLWALEHNQPDYILRVLLGVIGVSVETAKEVRG